jgi:putative spermidine/putrescine transport system substrate-binding protein
MFKFHATRRGVLAGISGAAALGTSRAFAQGLPLPTSPVVLSIIDTAGNLQLTQEAIEAFVSKNPKLVSRVVFSRAPAPELPAKLKAQQAANRVDIDLVLGGIGVTSDGVEQGLWLPLFPAHAASLPKPEDIYHPAALNMYNTVCQGQGMEVVYTPSGPVLEYAPERVKNPPKTAQELLDWTRQNKNKFFYARPANSGPGWTFMMGMPYVLKDSDPKDPINGWSKTWEYLKELGKNIEYYPGNTSATMKEFGEGARDIIVSTCGWDINPRALGIVPKSAAITTLQGFHWVADAQFMCIPKGVPNDKVAVLLQLMSYMLQPAQQAMTYDKGYLYPGPAVKNVPLSMAPPESQNVLKEFGRPEYDKLIADNPNELPLTPKNLVAAFRRWDQDVGAQQVK